MFKFSIRHLVSLAFGVPIFFLLARFLSVPLYDNAGITLAYAVLALYAIIYGPIIGLLIGIIGHILVDLTLFMGPSWSWIIVGALVGFSHGLIFKPGFIDDGVFKKPEIMRFMIGSAVIHMVSWTIIAPILDLVFSSAPAGRAFIQGIVAGLSNSVTTAIFGTVIIFIYMKITAKSNKTS